MREATDKFARRRPVEDALWQSFAEGIFYVNGTFEDPATYAKLKRRLLSAMNMSSRSTLFRRRTDCPIS